MARGSGTFNFIEGYRIQNPRWKAFQRTKNASSAPVNCREYLYHGTRASNVPSVLLRSLRLQGRSLMFGKAIYLTPQLKKALAYTGYGHHFVFVATALLGKIKVFGEGRYDLNLELANKKGFDTACGQSNRTKAWGSSHLQHTEYAVYDPKKVLITHLLYFSDDSYHPKF
jgi:hypothetical protein